ncbi:MAG: PH domain-containing protein [Kangiellaceae bacterium]|nr:PH domain-containing protein [Kangiellaceae bacterium]
MPSSNDEQLQATEYRLHKTSPLFILFDNIKKLIFPAFLALVSSRGSYWEYIALAIAAFVSIGSIIQYYFYRYWLEEKQIRVKEGILFRNVRQVPYNKIQNLNLIQNPLHRIFGVVKVQLESASGGKPEAVINVIDMQAVKLLRQRLNDEHEELEANEASVENKKTAILTLPFAEIARYGIISNRGLVVVAVFFGFLSQFLDGPNESLIKSSIKSAVNTVEGAVDSVVASSGVASAIAYSIAFLFVALICLWLLSIGLALFKFHDFELLEKKQKLSATMGLLTRLQATIPMSRIQSLTVHNSLLHRWFKRIGVTIETAGGVNTEQQGVTMKHIAPVLPKQLRISYLQQVQKDVDWTAVNWTLVEPRAWKRVFKVSWVLWTLGLLITNAYSPYLFATLWLLAGAWSAIYGKLYVKNTGYYLANDVIAYKSGVIFKKETYVRLPKIQTVEIKENPFDRRHQMATLQVDTAGAALGAHHIEIPYLNLKNAQAMQAILIQKVKNIDFQW